MKKEITKKFLAAILSISLLLQIGGPLVYAYGGEEINRTETSTYETRGTTPAAIELSLQGSDKLTINQTGYKINSGEEVSHTGPYVLTGSTTSNIDIKTSCHITLKDLTIDVGEKNHAIYAQGDHTINIKLEGKNTIVGYISLIGDSGNNTFTITEDSTGALDIRGGGGIFARNATINSKDYNINILGGVVNIMLTNEDIGTHGIHSTPDNILNIAGATVNFNLTTPKSACYCFNGFSSVIIKNSIISQGAFQELGPNNDDPNKSYILFNADNTRGTLEGKPTFDNLTIEESQTLTIPAGNTLTVANLSQNGTIDISGTLNVTERYNKGANGKLFKRDGGTIAGVLNEGDIDDLSDLPKVTIEARAYKDILIEADGYTTEGDTKVPHMGAYIITGGSPESPLEDASIHIENMTSANVTLKDYHAKTDKDSLIGAIGYEDAMLLAKLPYGNLYLTLEGSNSFSKDELDPLHEIGVYGGDLTIDGSGGLNLKNIRLEAFNGKLNMKSGFLNIDHRLGAIENIQITGGRLAVGEVVGGSDITIEGDTVVYAKSITSNIGSVNKIKGVVYEGSQVGFSGDQLTLSGGSGTVYGNPDVSGFKIPTNSKLGIDLSEINVAESGVTASISDLVYSGVPAIPSVSVVVNKTALQKTLVQDEDYTIEITSDDKVNAGEKIARITGLGGSGNINSKENLAFNIKKAEPTVELTIENKDGSSDYIFGEEITLSATVTGVNDEKPKGKVTFKDGETTIVSGVEVVDGVYSYKWTNASAASHNIRAEFTPDTTDTIAANYNEKISQLVNINIAKANQVAFTINEVADRKYNSGKIALSTTGGSGTGAVTYSVPDNNGVLTINGDQASIIGVGTVTVTARKAGDNNHNEVTTTQKITIGKAEAPSITFPTASGITYGQKLSESTLTGGSEDLGSFEWTDKNEVPSVSNKGYQAKFTPNADTVKNYKEIETENKVKDLALVVGKANPPVSVTADVYAEAGSRGLILKARVSKVGDGETPTGTIEFVNTTSGSAIDITGEESVAVENGLATYTWAGLEDGIYKVKAIYSGDHNHNTTTSNESTFDTSKQNQTNFNISDIEDKSYGDPSFTLSSTGGNGSGAVSFRSSNSDILSIDGKLATIHKAGTVQITATKAGDDNYNSAAKTLSLSIGKKPLNIKADDKLNIIKGTSLPDLTYTSSGLVEGDKFTTQPNISLIDGDIDAVGEYVIEISGGELDNSDSYTISYTNGKLSVVEALYRATVTKGTGTGDYSQGQRVTIVASDQSGYTFTQWTGTEGVEFEDKTSTTTSFTMPNKPVNITANYKKDSSGDNTGGGSSNTGGSSGGGVSSGGSPISTVTTTPAIKDASNQAGWEAIKEQINKTREGDTVTIEMNDSSVVPGEVLDAIRGTDATLVFDMGEGITWSINGQSITEGSLKDVNLDITLDTDAIPTEIINQIAGEQQSSTLSLAYDGPFGFTSVLTVNLDKINEGKYGNLFYYNPETKQLTLQAVGQIGENGSIELPFVHASDYVVIISEEPMLEQTLDQIEISAVKKTLYVGGTEKKSMTLKLELPQILKEAKEQDSSILKISYQSSNPKVATVNASGKIKAKKSGKTTITTQVTINGVKKKFKTKITVKKAYIKLIGSKKTLKTGSTFTYKAVGYGVKTKDIMYYTSKKAIVVINKTTGKARARSKGTDYVIAKAGKIIKKIKVKVS